MFLLKNDENNQNHIFLLLSSLSLRIEWFRAVALTEQEKQFYAFAHASRLDTAIHPASRIEFSEYMKSTKRNEITYKFQCSLQLKQI